MDFGYSAQHRRPRTRTFAAVFLITLVALVSACDIEGVGPATDTVFADLHLQVGINPSLPTEGSPPIWRVVVEAHFLDGSETVVYLVDVNPLLDEWSIDLELPIPEPVEAEREVFVTVRLLDRVGSAHWSGESPPFAVAAEGNHEVPSFDLLRGPLGNAAVAAVAIDPVPPLEVGEEVEVRATLTVPDPTTYVRYFMTSLDPDVATVTDERHLTTVSLGTARILAVAGWAADTIQVTVVEASDGAGARSPVPLLPPHLDPRKPGGEPGNGG